MVFYTTAFSIVSFIKKMIIIFLERIYFRLGLFYFPISLIYKNLEYISSIYDLSLKMFIIISGDVHK